ncbi:MAG TPA: helix-hairpin-helix domain-containing protein [Candidatus Limnocylindrales bacterium]|nr:helix-hairpin-helix domain-containing protein [Candidatus Limnocylindrales bacterium]
MNESASTRAWIVSLLLLGAALLIGAAALLGTRPQPVEITILPPQPTATATATPPPAPVMIYVTGAVARPESLVSLPAGSRVEDAIAAAGGAQADADLTAVNQAARVMDGDQVHVPHTGETTALATASVNLVYINLATAQELEALPDVGPAMAAAIIARRESVGPFTSLDDLDAIDGVGPRMLETLGPLLSFDQGS